MPAALPSTSSQGQPWGAVGKLLLPGLADLEELWSAFCWVLLAWSCMGAGAATVRHLLVGLHVPRASALSPVRP